MVAGVLAQPSSAAPAPVPSLAGTVTISGTVSGYAEVVLPKPAVLAGGLGPEAAAAIKVSGGGQFAGFALAAEDEDGPLIVGGHSPASAPTAERPEELTLNYRAGVISGDYELAAGRYRLYLITGDKPTTVTLKLRGLTGTSRLTPTTRTDAVVSGGPLAAATGSDAAGAVYSRGDAANVTTPFVQFYVNKLDAQVHTETVNRACLYVGRRPSGPLAYGPACASVDPQTGVAFGGGFVFAVSDENVFGGAYYSWGGAYFRVVDGADEITQDYGGGFSATTASVVRGTDYSQVWLELNADPAAAAPSKPTTATGQQALPQEQPAAAPPAAEPTNTASATLPATGLPTPVLAAAALLLLAAAAAPRTRSRAG